MENVVLENREESLGKTNSSVVPLLWLSLRITLDTELADQSSYENKFFKKSVLKVVEEMSRYCPTGRMTWGLEFLNKLGEYTYPHMHIAFQTTEKKDSVARQLKRWWLSQYAEKLSGNKMYALKIDTNIDEERYFRYPLKEYDNLDLKLHRATPAFSLTELERMRGVANAQWKIGMEVANTKKDKREQSDTLYERMEHSLDKLEEISKVIVMLAILDFYMNENRPINNNIMVGYGRLYLLKKGFLDKHQYAQDLASQI